MRVVFYILSYDTTTGYGKTASVVNSQYTIDLAEYSSEGYYAIADLPSGFDVTNYKANLSDLDENNLPNYIVERSTGYAYDHSATRVPAADMTPETAESSGTSYSDIESRDLTIGDFDSWSSDSGSSSGSSSGPGSGSGSESEEPMTAEEIQAEQEAQSEAIDRHMSAISSGDAVLVNIGISGGSASNGGGWSLDAETNKWVRAIENEHITKSTALVVTGVNREVLRDHVKWASEDGRIILSTDYAPSENLIITGFFFETVDEWSARGTIEAWPASGITSKRFRQSLNPTGWSTTLSARGVENDSKLILTNLQFGNAKLLFATPEWTGHSHVVIPQIYVDTTNNNRLAYRLTNLSDTEVEITEVMIRLCYLGNISGLVEDSADDASFEPYITPVDIDLMTGSE